MGKKTYTYLATTSMSGGFYFQYNSDNAEKAMKWALRRIHVSKDGSVWDGGKIVSIRLAKDVQTQ